VRRVTGATASLEATGETLSIVTGGTGGRVFSVKPRPEDRLVSLEFRGRFPSRTNTSHRFQVRGASSPLSTDIASGAKPWVFPPKHSHWGHGIVSRDFETVITLNNVAHRASERGANQGVLTIYLGDGSVVTSQVAVPREGVSFVYLRSLVPALASSVEPQTLSWMLKMERPNVDALWVAFAKDGQVCGDHAF
jgi:hypothetical protein